MAENSKIEWTHHTFNPWWGCAKVSPGCDHCYAERDAARFMPGKTIWGVDAARREFGDKHWNEPRKWDRKAQAEGVRFRVFAASMADVFDKNAPAGARDRLFALIRETPNLDWLLLTKRIGNAKSMLPADWGDGYSNVWLGASIVNQEEADRDIPKLLAVPARVRWLSMEPLIGPVDLRFTNGLVHGCDAADYLVDWVVVGGESGPHKIGYKSVARPMHPDWPRKIRDQCAAAGVPFLFKQWGNWAPHDKPPTPGTNNGAGAYINIEGRMVSQGEYWEGRAAGMSHVGKHESGRLLDNVQHDGYPKVEA
jgi:protein gp37